MTEAEARNAYVGALRLRALADMFEHDPETWAHFAEAGVSRDFLTGQVPRLRKLADMVEGGQHEH